MLHSVCSISCASSIKRVSKHPLQFIVFTSKNLKTLSLIDLNFSRLDQLHFNFHRACSRFRQSDLSSHWLNSSSYLHQAQIYIMVYVCIIGIHIPSYPCTFVEALKTARCHKNSASAQCARLSTRIHAHSFILHNEELAKSLLNTGR